MLYLRARWYLAETGTFLSRDVWEGDILQPRTLTGWRYVEGNPINRLDPSGYCSRTGNTDCQRFVSEVRCIIEGLRNGLQECTWTWPLDETQLVIDFLAHYYSFIRLREPIFDTFYIPGLPLLGPLSKDRWHVPDWGPAISQGRGFDWDWPINDPNSEEGKRDRQKYGFKRPYFEQTHHFFAFLKFSYHWSGPLTEWYNKKRETEDQIIPALNAWREAAQNPVTPPSDLANYPHFYRWNYAEAVRDLYIVSEAADLALQIAVFGVDTIPGYLERNWCAKNEADVWSLEGKVNEYYYNFSSEYWPETVNNYDWIP